MVSRKHQQHLNAHPNAACRTGSKYEGEFLQGSKHGLGAQLTPQVRLGRCHHLVQTGGENERGDDRIFYLRTHGKSSVLLGTDHALSG